jgi:hypothetical protein
VLETRRKITVAGRGPQHQLLSFRHDPDLRYRQIPDLPFDGAQSAAQRRARSKEQLVVIPTCKRGAHGILAQGPMVFTHAIRERNRLAVNGDSDP